MALPFSVCRHVQSGQRTVEYIPAVDTADAEIKNPASGSPGLIKGSLFVSAECDYSLVWQVPSLYKPGV